MRLGKVAVVGNGVDHCLPLGSPADVNAVAGPTRIGVVDDQVVVLVVVVVAGAVDRVQNPAGVEIRVVLEVPAVDDLIHASRQSRWVELIEPTDAALRPSVAEIPEPVAGGAVGIAVVGVHRGVLAVRRDTHIRVAVVVAVPAFLVVTRDDGGAGESRYRDCEYEQCDDCQYCDSYALHAYLLVCTMSRESLTSDSSIRSI